MILEVEGNWQDMASYVFEESDTVAAVIKCLRTVDENPFDLDSKWGKERYVKPQSWSQNVFVQDYTVAT